MKKSLIVLIIAVVVIGTFIGGKYVAHANPSNNISQNNQNSNQIQNSQTTSNNNSNTNNVNSSNTSSSNNSENSNGSSTSNSDSTNKNNNNSSQTVDWSAINANATLNSETVQSFAQEANNISDTNTNNFEKNYQNSQYDLDRGSYKIYQSLVDYANNKIIPAISENLNSSELESFNNLVNYFHTYNLNSVSAIYPNNSGGTMLPMEQNLQGVSYESNFINYLVGGYVNTGTNPLLSQQFVNAYDSQANKNATYQKFIGAVTETQNKSTQLSTQMNSNNGQDVLDTYSQIYQLWNNQIDTVYNYIKANSNGYISSGNLTNTELVWIKFRDQAVSNAGNGLTGINKEIAQKRMAIRMTQLQTYNLMGYLSYSVGQDL